MKPMIVDLSRFHDAELTGLRISRREKWLRLDFLAENGDELAIIFEGVEGFRAVDLGTQNVVSQLVPTWHADFEERDILRALEWVSAMVDAPPYLSPQSLSHYLARIRNEEMYLLMLDASAGGSLGVLARRVTFDPKQTARSNSSP